MITIPHLETDITSACQLSCVACNHHVPLYRQHPALVAEPHQVESDLKHFTKIARAEVWGALGGEPLMHNKLVDILKIVRDSGVAPVLEVWTNGLMLNRMTQEFWKSFDVLVLSVYPGKHTDASLYWITTKCEDESVKLVVKDERYQPNFKTLLEPTPTTYEATKSKFAGCFFRHFSRVLNHGYVFTCCCAPHMPVLLQGKPYGTDGIAVAGLSEAGLRAYLERTEPLGACSMCAGRDTAVSIPWSEEKNPLEWTEKSKGFLQAGSRIRQELI